VSVCMRACVRVCVCVRECVRACMCVCVCVSQKLKKVYMAKMFCLCDVFH